MVSFSKIINMTSDFAIKLLFFHGCSLHEAKPFIGVSYLVQGVSPAYLVTCSLLTLETEHHPFLILWERHFAQILPAGCLMFGKQIRFMFFRDYILLALTNAVTCGSTAWLLK